MEKTKNKKKPNIVLFTILMIAIFTVISEVVIWGYGSKTISNAIENYPQGTLVIREAILASLVLIVLLLFKNSYVFTQKKENFFKGLYYGLYYIVIICLMTLFVGVIGGVFFKSGLALLNLAIGCIFIGIAEEFLCRGWLLNEFLERFGDTKKGVWYSIIISGVIFGLLHLGNMFGGQSVANTITQVVSAAATGIMFGLIYYKTKNIWSVIALHALWDFAVFLGQLMPTTYIFETFTSYTIIGVVFTIFMALAEVLNVIPHIKDIDKKPKTRNVVIFAAISVVLFYVCTFGTTFANTEMGKEYQFSNITIKNYSVTTDNYETYSLNYNNDEFKFELSKNDKKKVVLTNTNTNYEVELESINPKDMIMFEDKEYYVLSYIDFRDDKNIYLRFYYMNKKDLSNDNSYLDTIKKDLKNYMVPASGKLEVIHDKDSDLNFIAVEDKDTGTYLLVGDKVALLKK